MTADRTYSRVVFPPADACALGPVTIYAADGVTKIGVIPVEKLRQRKPRDLRESPKVSRGEAVTAHVPMVKAKTRAGRP